jgi:hypothetical protein
LKLYKNSNDLKMVRVHSGALRKRSRIDTHWAWWFWPFATPFFILSQHHLSHYHQFRSFTCPSPECRAAFLSESGVIAHLESGCCSSGVDQAMIDKSMVIRDPRQLFVRGARVSLPADREVPVQAGLYPCSLCPKKFQYRAGLLQHLGSSKHTNNGRDPYKCPASTCNKPTFPSLSSLLVHKERGKCGLDRDTALITTLDRYIYDLFDRIRNMWKGTIPPLEKKNQINPSMDDMENDNPRYHSDLAALPLILLILPYQMAIQSTVSFLKFYKDRLLFL